MKILVISQYFTPDIVAAAFRVTETVELLRNKGHAVRVVTARPHRVQVAGAHVPGAEAGVVRVPLIGYGKGGRLRYVTHYLSFMVAAMLGGLFRGGRADVVMATSPPLFVGVSGWVVARLKRARFVLDIRDIWPDSAVTTGHLSREGRMFRWAKWLELWLYRRADLITCVATPMAEYIRGFVPEKRVVIIYNGVQEKFLERPSVEHTENRLQLDPSRLNIVYVGNMGYCQALGVVVEAARKLQDAGDDRFRFYLVGGGVELEHLKALREQYRLRNLFIPGLVPKGEALRLVHDASAMFLQLKDDPTMEKTIPSKVFDYMVGGRPILFGIEGEGREILESVAGNLRFVPNDLGSLLRELEELTRNYEKYSVAAASNKAYVVNFTREKMIDKLENEFFKFS
mgnify:CR=1 FL=1